VSSIAEANPDPSARRRPWSVWLLAALGYFVLASLATWPVVTRFGREIPGELTDPLEHLWIMRWLRSCLIEGRNPLFCPAIQAPVGVPLGYFPTLHLQTALYLILRLLTSNDAAIFTAIWFVGFVATGLASFGLARWALPGLGAGVAWVAGLGVMLCGPMLMHAHGHLETMQLGVVPPFLIAWMRFNDHPGRGWLLLAVASYLLMVAAAPYFAVLAIFPAVWYSAWSVATGSDRWTRARRLAPWLVGFGAVALPGVAILFGGQVWAGLNGFPMTRSKRLFEHFGAPVWSSIVPSSRHGLGRVLEFGIFEGNGYAGRITECSSYLGLIALGLLGYAAVMRVRFPRRGFWWSVLGLMIVLSWGSRQDLFGALVSLPAGWIYDIFPPFHLIRVPARFNLFAAAVAPVPVAAGLRAVVERHRWPVRFGFLGTITVLTLADLAMVPFPTATIPEPPAYYAAIKKANPNATVIEAPLFDSTKGQTYSSLWGYWQQSTGLATSGGYPGLTNTKFDAEIAQPSAFWAGRRRNSDRSSHFGRDGTHDIGDRAWVEMTAHSVDFAILHQSPAVECNYGQLLLNDPMDKVYTEDGYHHVLAIIGYAMIDGNPEFAVFARSRLDPPNELTWMTDQGWRPVTRARDGNEVRSAALREARIVVYQPRAGSVLLRLAEVEAFARPRVVRVVEGTTELARWAVEPGAMQALESPPIPLSVGLHTWTIRSDGDSRPTRSADRLDDAATPYSFRLSRVHLVPVGPHGH